MNSPALFSSTRLPFDHFLSGSLIGAMGGAALNYEELKEGKISTNTFAKRVLKFSLDGGIATSIGIFASNSIVKGNYLNALGGVLLGASLLTLSNKITKKERDEKSIH